MEIVEIISYYINFGTNTLDIKFRLSEDSESELRVDEIDLTEAEDFGYTLLNENFGFFDDEDEGEDIQMEEEVDEDELMSFLNEYYTIYPDRIPLKELY